MAEAWVIAGIVVAAALVLAVVALLVNFALRRRDVRRTASLTDHPAGTAETLTNEPASNAMRVRRRDLIPPIRPAELGDEARLAEIDSHADEGLAGAGLGALPSPGLRAGDGPAAVLLVAGRPAVAYIRIDEVDGLAHLDRLGVLPVMARRGIGQALIDAAIEWANGHGYAAITLSTFVESDWNARVYDPTGFAPLQKLTPGLVELRDWERAIGLDAIGDRVVMRRQLDA